MKADNLRTMVDFRDNLNNIFFKNHFEGLTWSI